ncbi:MAG TPA: hypothetical protein VG271_00415 [Beijerinckiaceae bacterium]|nr:hypothetical protein [Beijerinckiaceae bacterium]
MRSLVPEDTKSVADLQRIGLDVSAPSGADVIKITREIDAAPQAAIDRPREIVSP